MPERNLNFDEIVNRRGTDCLKYDFAVRRGMPEDVLPLWVADMDFKTTSYVEDAVIERTKHGIFGYSESGEEYFKEVGTLKNRIIRYAKANIGKGGALNKLERKNNIKNAYTITNKLEIKNRKILLFDDVFTTGSTTNECSRVLKENGAKKIGVLTIAKD